MPDSKKPNRGVWAAACAVCGFVFDSDQLKKRWDGIYVCKEDWEPRHILDFYKPKESDISVPWSQPDNITITSYVAIDDTDSPYTATVSITQIDVDATDGNVTINLPLANTYTFAYTQQMNIRRTDSATNTVTIAVQGADTINGAASETLLIDNSKVYKNDAVSKWTNF